MVRRPKGALKIFLEHSLAVSLVFLGYHCVYKVIWILKQEGGRVLQSPLNMSLCLVHKVGHMQFWDSPKPCPCIKPGSKAIIYFLLFLCSFCQSKNIPGLLNCWHVNHVAMEINGTLFKEKNKEMKWSFQSKFYTYLAFLPTLLYISDQTDLSNSFLFLKSIYQISCPFNLLFTWWKCLVNNFNLSWVYYLFTCLHQMIQENGLTL